MFIEDAEFWRDCSFVAIDPEVMHGIPVFTGTRLPVETVIGSVDAYMELDGLDNDGCD